MRLLTGLAALVVWLFWLNHRARRGSRRARCLLGATLIVVGLVQVAIGVMVFLESGTVSGHGGRGGVTTLVPGDDPLLLALGIVFAGLWPLFLLVAGVGEINRARAPTPPAAPPSPRRR